MSEQYNPPTEATLRAAILDAIDAGCERHWHQPWLLNADIESLANQERLDFCDAVVKRLSAYKVDEARLKQAMEDTRHLDNPAASLRVDV